MVRHQGANGDDAQGWLCYADCSACRILERVA